MSFQTADPVTGKVKATYSFATAAEIESAVGRLFSSYKKWKNEAWAQRQTALKPLIARMQAERDSLAKTISEEMGKPIRESRDEVDKCIKTVTRILTEDLSFLEPQLRESAIYTESLVQQQPLGIIYSIMPWNLPLWQAVRMVMPTILAGNTVLLKHSELTPLTAEAIAKLFEGLYSQPVLLNLRIEHEKTEPILSDDRIGGVSLTGSVEAGRKVYQAAAAHFKKAVLELGGSDPYIVMPDANLDRAAQLVTKGRLLNAGQTCISAKRCLVPSSILEAFVEKLKGEFAQAVYGHPLDEKTTLGPLAHIRFKKSLGLQLETFRKETQARQVYSREHGQSAESAFVDLEIYVLDKNSSWLRDQEIFGPVLIVIPYESIEQAIETANATDFALGAGVIGEDVARAQQVAQKINAGHVAINSLVATDLGLPFGGFKSSGLGRELGREAYFEFLQTKVIARG